MTDVTIAASLPRRLAIAMGAPLPDGPGDPQAYYTIYELLQSARSHRAAALSAAAAGDSDVSYAGYLAAETIADELRLRRDTNPELAEFYDEAYGIQTDIKAARAHL